MTAPVADPSEANWSEVIGHREDVMLDGVDLFARHCVLHERAGGFPRLRVMNLTDGAIHAVDVPEAAYSVHGGANAEFDTDSYGSSTNRW